MTKELFEKAQFGDRFVTRGGQEALFLRLTENSEWQFANFYVKDWGQIRVNRENGKWLNGPDTKNDIVGIMPSLLSNLDEAAEKYAIMGISSNADPYEEIMSYQADKDAFKAGAEWMAEQGYSQEETVEDKCLEVGYGALPGISPIINLPDSFKPCDKVIVQVRKKQ